ncbi:ABC transporter ATP-binding protein [Labrys okinawensis]|uniref:ABC transporter ATP-binding protein n=1 Tax=Labrys okinawensis TaxID=346911 RepID=UPI0039BD50F4
MADVVLANVTKHFGDMVAVSDLTIEIADGSFMVLLGPTGAGKTTTLRLVAGLEVPDHGRVAIGHRDVTAEPPAARDVAFVFQQYSLYPHLSVYDNLAFPLRSPTRRTPEDEIRRKVTETAELLHIESKLGNRATNLSGGEMQRVALGRALVRRPAIYLMDEPLSSLDAKLRADLRLELKRIQMELGATLLYVTHDQIEAMTMATTIGVIQSGRIVQIGTPRQIYETPNSLYVAARLGQPSINLLPRRLLPGIAAPSEATTIGARTEHLRIAKARGAEAHGRVTWIEHLGDQNHLHIKIDQHEVVTLVDPDAGLAVGDEVGIVLVRPLFFDQDGIRIAT